MNERGTTQSGVLVQDGPTRIVFYRDSRSSFAKLYHTPSEQLRSDQGRDVLQWYREGLQKSGPLPCRKGAHSPSEADLKEAVCAARDARAAQQARQELSSMPQPQAELAQEPAGASNNDGEDSEDDVVVHNVEDAASPVLRHPLQAPKRKPKNKQQDKKAKEKAAEKAKARSLARSLPTRMSLPAASSQVLRQSWTQPLPQGRQSPCPHIVMQRRWLIIGARHSTFKPC